VRIAKIGFAKRKSSNERGRRKRKDRSAEGRKINPFAEEEIERNCKNHKEKIKINNRVYKMILIVNK